MVLPLRDDFTGLQFCHYGNFCLLGIAPLFLWEFLFVRSLIMSSRLVLTAGYLLNSSTSKIIDGP